jgi:hypothetical protein
MSTLPDLVGNDVNGRILPILPIDYQEFRFKQILEFYLNNLVCLLGNDQVSLQKFLQIDTSNGDYKHSPDVEALSELLSSEFDDESCKEDTVKIKVSFLGRAKTWTEHRKVTFALLLLHASRAFGKLVTELYYQNEFGDRAKLVGDRDLVLLINARGEKCKFFAA